MRFGVLGAGGVGGWLAAALHRAGEGVFVVARGDTLERISSEGISVRSVVHGDYAAKPLAGERLTTPVDFLFVATKATGLEAALDRIDDRAVEQAVVIPLLNGLDHMEILRRWSPGRVAAAVIRIEADSPEPGLVVQTSPSVLVEMASDGDVDTQRLQQLARALEAAGVPAAVGDSEASVLWRKLVRLGSLAATTAAIDRSIGFIRTDPIWRPRLIACIEEACAVAAAEGVDIPPARVLEELEATHEGLGSSLQRDVNRGNPSELEHIPGAIVRAGRRHGIPTPSFEARMGEIRERMSLIGK
jgi:2-dehydropantoate 2-reductase